MKQKMTVFVLLAFLLAGCGSSAPTAVGDGMPETRFTSPQSDTPREDEKADKGDPQETEWTGGSDLVLGNYFTIQRENNTITDDGGTELLYEYICHTDFNSADPVLDGWIDSILEQIHREYTANSSNLLEYAQESLTEGDSELFYGFSNYQEVGIARHDRKVVSIMVLSSIYSGGAHSNAVQTAWNLDVEKQLVLKLEDVLLDGAGMKLASMVQEKVDSAFAGLGENALFDSYEHTIADSFRADTMTPYWYLNDQGLVIFYNQYELGPYAAGIIKAVLPYGELEGLLREEYVPCNYDLQTIGNIVLRGDCEGCTRIPVVIDPAGNELLIGIEGTVSQVQLSEVYWLEGTAIGQKMLFSADCLNQYEVLVLTGGFDDETRSFAVEFIDGAGNNRLYYIHPDGLSEIP